MEELNSKELEQVAGGMKTDGRQSDNVEDRRYWETYINPGSGMPASNDNPRFRN